MKREAKLEDKVELEVEIFRTYILQDPKTARPQDCSTAGLQDCKTIRLQR